MFIAGLSGTGHIDNIGPKPFENKGGAVENLCVVVALDIFTFDLQIEAKDCISQCCKIRMWQQDL